MPAYSYYCEPCQAETTVFKNISKLERVERCGHCDAVMQRRIVPVPAHVHAGTPKFHQRSRP